MSHFFSISYIEADYLESQENDPVRYHEAWQQLCRSDGVLVPGGFGMRGLEGKILAANWARTNSKPYLGVCLGLQCAVIEFARNVLKWEDADTTEVKPDSKHPVVIEMPEHNTGIVSNNLS